MGRPITARKPHIAYLYDYTGCTSCTLHEPMELPGLTRGSGAFSESELTHPVYRMAAECPDDGHIM